MGLADSYYGMILDCDLYQIIYQIVSKYITAVADFIKLYHHCCRLYEMKYLKKITLLIFLFSSNVCAQIIREMPGKLKGKIFSV